MANNIGKMVWKNGNFINWDDANIHVLSHVVQYGTCVFEGIRSYDTNKGAAVFRLKDHMQRLINSAKVYRMDTEYSVDQLVEAALETIRINKFQSCYIRPFIFRGFGPFGVNPLKNPIEVYIAIWEWGKYLGPEALENGVDVCVSSWNRLAPNTMPALAKAGANYMNSQLIKMEAITNGFDEGIALDQNGFVAEGSGENIFIIRDGKIYTPPLCSSILPGITRFTAIELLKRRGYTVIEETIPRESLYTADELFFTGTAAEITPIRSVDRITIGAGKIGPITKTIQNDYFNIFEGGIDIPDGWLSYI